MTDPTRPPGFKVPSPKPAPLRLFFGRGDYVIARTATEASLLWMEHFDDLCYAREFEQIPDNEEVEAWVEDNLIATVATRASANERFARKLKMNAAWWIRRFGRGYLASTVGLTDDD